MFSSLRVKNFRIYWCGMFVSLIGTWIQATAQGWLVFQLSKSAFLLGIVGFLSSIPVFLLSLFGGVLADRVSKRNILIWTQLSFMALAFILALLTQARLITPQQIMLVAVLNGIVMAFDAPARQAVIVELVGKENLFNAITLNSVAFNSSRIIGPAIAGILVAVIGMSGCFYINGISFLAVIIALLFINLKVNSVNGKNSAPLVSLKEGLWFIKNNHTILVLIAMVGLVSLFGISYVLLMPIFASDILKVGVRGFGLLMSASGFGALLGALFLARLGDFRTKGKFLVISSFVFSVALVMFSLSRAYLLSLIFLFFIGASSVAAIALVNTILQVSIPDDFRGRVMSVFMLTFAGLMPFGNLIAGGLAHILGVTTTVMASGIICGGFFLIINIIYPRIRDI
jgi:MFS family permease